MFVFHEIHRNYHLYPEILSSTVKSYKKDVDIIFANKKMTQVGQSGNYEKNGNQLLTRQLKKWNG